MIAPSAGVDFVKVQRYFHGNIGIQLERSSAFVGTVRWDLRRKRSVGDECGRVKSGCSVEQPVLVDGATAKSRPVAYINHVRNIYPLADKVVGHCRVFYKCIGYSRGTNLLVVAPYPHIDVKDAVGEVVLVRKVDKVRMNGQALWEQLLYAGNFNARSAVIEDYSWGEELGLLVPGPVIGKKVVLDRSRGARACNSFVAGAKV
jgi:hypothetical protein